MAYIGRSTYLGSIIKLDSLGTFNGVTQTFNLIYNSISYAATTSIRLLVVKNGSPLEPNIDFIIDTTTITFDSAPIVTDKIFIMSYGSAINIGVPNDGSITDEKFKPSSIERSNFTQEARETIISNIVTFGI